MGQLYPDDENHLLLNEITRITTQEPGNALNSFISTTPITPLAKRCQYVYRRASSTAFYVSETK